MEQRYEELFSLIQAELRRSGYEEMIPAGIVLTGGTSRMEGAVELAEEVFHMPVRLAYPTGVTGLIDVVQSPVFSTGVGLLLHGLQQLELQGSKKKKRAQKQQAGWFTRFKDMVKHNF